MKFSFCVPWLLHTDLYMFLRKIDKWGPVSLKNCCYWWLTNRINRHAHHLLEREGIVSNGQPITAAKVCEHGISEHQLQSGGRDPKDELCQNRWRRVCSIPKKKKKKSLNEQNTNRLCQNALKRRRVWLIRKDGDAESPLPCLMSISIQNLKLLLHHKILH